jgi:biotin operon repressor
MFEWLFGRKKEVNGLKEEVRESFEHVKNDIENISRWVKHLNEQDSKQEFKFSDVEARLSSIEDELEGVKNSISLLDMANFKQLFKTPARLFGKQTAVQAVQSAVQTPVQTAENVNLSNFSLMERALIMVLLNSDLKLSYDDLAAMTGKSRATIRGQVNSIKQKSEGLVEEIIEKNGKKRVFVPENIKEKLLKNVKVRVSKYGKTRKRKEEE